MKNLINQLKQRTNRLFLNTKDLIRNLDLHKRQIIALAITLVLAISIVVGVYLVQVQHIFISRANIPGIEAKTSSGENVLCDEQSAECVTDNPEDVTITVNREHFENLEVPNP